LGENDMMAYLTMMANRLLELHRVLKPTGSLYLHCDSTASHYLKIVLDGVFGKENYRNEITWKRQSGHNDAIRKYGVITDTIFFYVKTEKALFNVVRKPLNEDYVANFYRHNDEDGRGLYRQSDMSAPAGGGMAAINKATGKPNGWYEWQGYQPPERGWRYKKETMQRLHDEGRIYYPEDKNNRPRLKRFLDENEGQAVPNLWDDIQALTHAAAESLGYPTQKPVTLLERIIQASSQTGDVVLDPFCGCGTAVHAAQKLGRQWIGIDITHLAISLIEKRLHDAFPQIEFAVEGTPKDFEGARDLALRDKYQFQWWACSLVNAQPFQGKKKGADGGIDGLIYFKDDSKLPKKIIVSVKGGENVSRTMVADLKNAVEREKAQLGLFVTLTPPTAPMKTEASAAGFYDSPHHGSFPKIQILTVAGLLLGTERARYPDMSYGVQTFKPAKVEEKTRDQTDLF
jgi:DNA modification methylase